MGTINTFNFYPEAIDKAATKAKEAVCSATEIIKHKISDAALTLKDKASNILDEVDRANHQSETLLKKSQEIEIEIENEKR
uniref:Uncharacterized protein n=1 Tax=Wuchereria bancrofti TaxID=6293 RepID=A0AAF5PQQ6_WUCBA